MISIDELRHTQPGVLVVGSPKPEIQAILDFDYLSGRKQPSVQAIWSTGSKEMIFDWGNQVVAIPVVDQLDQLPTSVKQSLNMFLSYASGRRTRQVIKQLLDWKSDWQVGTVFAEDVPELHAQEIIAQLKTTDLMLMGPASIGLLIPHHLKLGPIGGVRLQQLLTADLFRCGETAVFSASGGMTNELINLLAQHGHHLSFALSVGGERFPFLTPAQAMLLAQQDPQTKQIVYYGELGGEDEYQVAELIKTGQLTKPVLAYIAGSISQQFERPPQFGHAKAMAKSKSETAQAKRQALNQAGAQAFEQFGQLADYLKKLPAAKPHLAAGFSQRLEQINSRQKKLFVSRISGEVAGEVRVLNRSYDQLVDDFSIASLLWSLWLGRKIKSQLTEQFAELVFKLSVDHSPQVSGGVNTMIAARAGKDLISAVVSGMLTIGPRFGGATAQAARNWYQAVHNQQSAIEFVEQFASQRKRISGIGHRKYRVDRPDPRVVHLQALAKQLDQSKYWQFAKEVEQITLAKKANLILNVDGAIAALGLDILAAHEGLTEAELAELVGSEFFNALFVYARTAGFIAHYLDQTRHDQGLFRLPGELIAYLPEDE